MIVKQQPDQQELNLLLTDHRIDEEKFHENNNCLPSSIMDELIA